ncbi:MAG TPA: type II secretion system F family protein, partial [Longimicrobiaceae bacterium]|nr:type II secretion system F family protein [Longimicrobiaceae bacterium]
ARESTLDIRGRRRKAVLDFTWGMAALLPAGMPIGRALTVASATSPAFIRPVLDRVRERVERGEEMAKALAAEPGTFSPLYIGVIQAGEKGGALGSAFDRLAAHLDREDRLRGKLLSMSIYPAMLGVVGLASVLVLVLFVLPRFADLLTGTGAPLPAMTAFVLGVATAARENWPIIVAGLGAIAAIFVWMRTSVGGRAVWSRLLARTPVIGAPRREILSARFARMVGELTAGGAPLLSAIRVARDCIDDPLGTEVAGEIWTRVREGSTLNHAIGQHTLFPSEMVQLVALGEEAGRLSEFLLKAADLLERRTERTLERLVALIEPAMIVAFGGVIAVVALSLLQAIYGVNASGL